MATFDERFALPTQLPELADNRLFNDYQVTPGTTIGNKLFGAGGEERFQTWPERMIRSGLALPADVYSGREPIVDESGHTAQPVIERTQDLAGLAGMSSIPLAEKGALGAIGGKFYSSLENTIQGSKVQKGTPEQWNSYLKNQPGVKPEELEFSLAGLPEKVLTKDELAAHVADNGIKFGEVVKEYKPYQDIKDQTKYSSYQLPGGENYRELLMTVPSQSKDKFIKEYQNKTGVDISKYTDEQINNLRQKAEGIISDTQYKSSHWDEPNVLAHIRMNDREIPGVGKTLHVEEIQSDWHQAGRKGGYKGQNITAEDNAIRDRIQNNKATEADYKAWENGLGDKFAKDTDSSLVPNAPFKKTWDELALKRVLSEAAEKGYDAVSWTPGEAQAARYDLSKQVDNVKIWPDGNGKYYYEVKKGTRDLGLDGGQAVSAEKLRDTIGKEITDKAIKDIEDGKAVNYSGLDLKVGGEGMKAFYDTMLPTKANALIKKMGGKVEYEHLPPTMENAKNQNMMRGKGEKVPIIKITPQMRETIASKGFPLYSSGVPTFTPVDSDPHKKQPKLVPIDYNPFETTP